MGSDDQRVHARIHISTSIEVASASGTREAQLRDLSKGGARFVTAAPVGPVGDTVELFLPSLGGDDIAVVAEIIRADDGPEGHTVAVRFETVAPEMRQPLHDLIEVLLTATGGGARAAPRVARRMDIRYGQLGELRAILEDMSRGGLAMTVAQPLDGEMVYRVGLEFAELRTETRRCLDELLKTVLESLDDVTEPPR